MASAVLQLKAPPRSGNRGQCELGVKFAPIIQAADGLMTYKYVIRNVAKKHGKTVTHSCQAHILIMVLECTSTSLSGRWKTLVRGRWLCWLEQDGIALHWRSYQTCPSSVSLTNPTTTLQAACSCFEAPVNLAYSARNRSASIHSA